MSDNSPNSLGIIILVDDDPAVRSSIQFAFELEGYTVRAFPDPAAVLANLDFPERSCLVLDYNLPGMNGLDLLEQMRAHGVNLPALLITTHPLHAMRERAEASGVVIVEKPFLGNELSQSVKDLLSAIR
ncbi:MAG: response regulator [Alphaproteobacteria bacterium]|nr:response regulator [Alphaproteobacteria bacterium]